MLIETRYLEDCEVATGLLGSIGTNFMIRRLLFTQFPVCPRWDGIRRISRKFADDENNGEETYENYIKLLCHKAANLGASMKDLCDPESQGRDYDHRSCRFGFKYDLITAAVYANKLHFIDELGDWRCNFDVKDATFGTPYQVAVEETIMRRLTFYLQRNVNLARASRSFTALHTSVCVGTCV